MSDPRIPGRPRPVIAVLGLVIAAFFWGLSYPLTKFVENVPTFYILSVRFIVATGLLLVLFHRHLSNLNRTTLLRSIPLAVNITLMYVVGTVGIKYTTSIRASFFTTLSFLVVPVLNLILFRLKISRTIIISALICMAGLFLLCYAPGMGGFSVNLGDFLCFLGSVTGAVNIVGIERTTTRKEVDPIVLSILLMAFIAVCCTAIAAFTGEFSYRGCTPQQMTAIVFMGMACSAGAFAFQTYFSQFVPSNRTGIIFALEPASGCILSVVLVGEAMAWTGWLGAFIIMLSILFMEISSSRQAEKEITS